MVTIVDVTLQYPLVCPLLRTPLPVAHSLSWIFLASHLWPLHLAPTDREQYKTRHLQEHGIHHKLKTYASNSPFTD